MRPGDSPSYSIRFPLWEREYRAALSETDAATLLKRAEAAEAAVRIRRASFEAGSDHHAERQAMEEALVRLGEIQRNHSRSR